MSQWLVQNTETNRVVWQGNGGSIPSVIVDNKLFKDLFTTWFPHVEIIWGGNGELKLTIIDGMGVFAVGSIAYIKPDGAPAHGNKPGAVTTTDYTGGAVVVKTDEDREAELRKHMQAVGKGTVRFARDGDEPEAGITRMGFDNLKPVRKSLVNPVCPVIPTREQAAPCHPAVGSSPRDTPLFQMFVAELRATLVLSDPTWADRVRGLPDKVRSLVLGDYPASYPNLTGWAFRGFTQPSTDPNTHVSTDRYNKFGAGDDKVFHLTQALASFQRLEMGVTTHRLVKSNSVVSLHGLLSNAWDLAWQSAVLYQLESGKSHADAIRDAQPFIDEVSNFLADKDADYGQAIRRRGPEGVTVRLWDKWSRYLTLKTADRAPKFESILDSLKDSVGYSLIMLGLVDEALEDEALEDINNTKGAEV